MPQLKVHDRTPLSNKSRKDKMHVLGRLVTKYYWWNPFIEVTHSPS